MKNITIKDVAKMAGVSPRTVSRVINHDPNVKSTTREKVLKIVEETGFEANLLAKGLREKRTNTLVAFIDQHQDSYWGSFHNQILQEMMRESHRRNYRMVISSSSADSYGEDDNDGFTILKHGLADGAIMFDTKSGDKRIQYLHDREVPFVIFGKDNDYFDTSYVDLDNTYAGYLGAEYLITQGRKRIAFLLGNEDYIVNQDRAKGFNQYFMQTSQENAVGEVFYQVDSISAAYKQTKMLLEQSESLIPDAIYISGDERAIGVYRAIYEKNLRIPDDIGVLGIDNIIMGQYYHPPITTIDQSIASIVISAFDILLQQLKRSENGSKRILITPKIHERQSV